MLNNKKSILINFNKCRFGEQKSITTLTLLTASVYTVEQWFSNFLHQVPPQKIFGFPSTTIMTNIKMQYKWVCVHGVCVCALWMG